MLRNFLRSEILSGTRQVINVRCSREFRPTRGCSSQRCDTVRAPSDNECPPKMRCLMDLYPIPCGSWKENYDAKNAIYNRQLLVAIGIFVVSFFAMNRVGWVKGYPEVTLF